MVKHGQALLEGRQCCYSVQPSKLKPVKNFMIFPLSGCSWGILITFLQLALAGLCQHVVKTLKLESKYQVIKMPLQLCITNNLYIAMMSTLSLETHDEQVHLYTAQGGQPEQLINLTCHAVDKHDTYTYQYMYIYAELSSFKQIPPAFCSPT